MDITFTCDYANISPSGRDIQINAEGVSAEEILDNVENEIIVESLNIDEIIDTIIVKGYSENILNALIEHGCEGDMEQSLIDNGYEFGHDK